MPAAASNTCTGQHWPLPVRRTVPAGLQRSMNTGHGPHLTLRVGGAPMPQVQTTHTRRDTALYNGCFRRHCLTAGMLPTTGPLRHRSSSREGCRYMNYRGVVGRGCGERRPPPLLKIASGCNKQQSAKHKPTQPVSKLSKLVTGGIFHGEKLLYAGEADASLSHPTAEPPLAVLHEHRPVC